MVVETDIVWGVLFEGRQFQNHEQKMVRVGHLGGSVVEHLPLAQGVTQGSWDQMSPWGSLQGACFSLCLYLPLCVSLMNKYNL